MDTPFFQTLKQVPGVHEVKWNEAKELQGICGEHYMPQSIRVFSELNPQMPIEFDLTRNNHRTNNKAPFTVTAFFSEPPANLRAEAWRILLQVCSGKELVPEVVKKVAIKSMAMLDRGAKRPLQINVSKPVPVHAKGLVKSCLHVGFAHIVQKLFKEKHEHGVIDWKEKTNKAMIEVPSFLLREKYSGQIFIDEERVAKGRVRAELLQQPQVFTDPGNGPYATAMDWLLEVSRDDELGYLKWWRPWLNSESVGDMLEYALFRLRIDANHDSVAKTQLRCFEALAINLFCTTPEQLREALVVRQRTFFAELQVGALEPGAASSSSPVAENSHLEDNREWQTPSDEELSDQDDDGDDQLSCEHAAVGFEQLKLLRSDEVGLGTVQINSIALDQELIRISLPELLQTSSVETTQECDALSTMKAMKERAVEHVRYRSVGIFFRIDINFAKAHALREDAYHYIQSHRNKVNWFDTRMFIPECSISESFYHWKVKTFINEAHNRGVHAIKDPLGQNLNRFQKLLSQFPATSLEKFTPEVMESQEGRFRALRGLAALHQGEVVELDRARTTWILGPKPSADSWSEPIQVWCMASGEKVGKQTVPECFDEYGRSSASGPEREHRPASPGDHNERAWHSAACSPSSLGQTEESLDGSLCVERTVSVVSGRPCNYIGRSFSGCRRQIYC